MEVLSEEPSYKMIVFATVIICNTIIKKDVLKLSLVMFKMLNAKMEAESLGLN